MHIGRSDPAPRHLPRRDYLLLPLIFVLTILVILAGGEAAARILYPQDDDVEPCEYQTPAGLRFKPECTSHTKVWEGPWITQHFNACGYRTAESCAPRPPGALRVVVVGSSTSRGALVNYPQSFAARASAMLSQRCGGLVDFQNLGTEPVDVDRIDQRIPEALALHPAAIVLVLGPFDLVHLKDQPTENPEAPPFRLGSLVNLLRESRLFLLMQYYLYRDPAFQVRAFLLNEDAAGYVRRPLSPAWRQRIANLGDLLGRITARADGVPVIMVYVPERAQVALAGQVPDPAGIDPHVLGDALQAEAARHDVSFADATHEFAASPDFKNEFYLTDGHPEPAGHAAIAIAVEHTLLAQPVFARCAAARLSTK